MGLQVSGQTVAPSHAGAFRLEEPAVELLRNAAPRRTDRIRYRCQLAQEKYFNGVHLPHL